MLAGGARATLSSCGMYRWSMYRWSVLGTLYQVQELAAIINSETAGLRGNLTDARIAIGQVAVNREQARIRGGIASSELSASADLALQRNDPAAVAAYLDALNAASAVLSGRACGAQDPTHGAQHFIFDYGQRKPVRARGTPRLRYGPVHQRRRWR
jgi:hypothetical protein